MEQLSLLQKIYQYGETLSSNELNQIVQYLNSSIEAINTLIAKNNSINEGHCEMRFKVSVQQPNAPASGSDGTSDGWSDTYTMPDTANGECSWMTLSFFNGDGVYGSWSTPVCITWGSVPGQRGPKGESGARGAFKSRVFKRQNSKPTTPTGGTYDNPLPTSGGWHDGIPSGQAIIWSSVCTFYGNGLSSGWSEPAAESDTDTLDIEFSPSSVQPDPPIGNTPFTNHESEGWYDPSSTNFTNVGVMIWRAERKVSNGVYNGNWTITRIVGEKGAKGDSGDDGGHYKFRYCNFTPTPGHTTPTKPTQGSDGIGTFGSGANATTWAIGVSDPNVNAGEFTYMTSCYVVGDNEYGTWDDPIRITGGEGMAGEDGSDIEFIYTVNNTGNLPDAPIASGQGNARIFTEDDWYGKDENGIIWTDNPTGISLENQYEYVAIREKPAGRGSSWSSYRVALWSKWGDKGQDGDGFEYIFLLSQEEDPSQIANPTPQNWSDLSSDYQTMNEYAAYLEQHIPVGEQHWWTDEPQSITSIYPYVYVSKRAKKQNGEGANATIPGVEATKMVWGQFSAPSLWAKYAADSTVPGPPGAVGPMSYLAGIWNANTTYTKTSKQNPVVYYTNNDSYYYLAEEGSSTGDNPAGIGMTYTEQHPNPWLQAENYNMVFTDILFVNQFAKLGSFIVNQDWMLCQYGTIYDYGTGVHPIQNTTDSISVDAETTYTYQNAYLLFDPAYPDKRKPNDWNFVPNYAINAVTGEIFCNNAHITGEVTATSGTFNGTVNASGGIFNGIVNATQFKAGDDDGFSITTSPDSLDFNYNGNRLAFFSLRGWDSTNDQLADVADNPTGFYLYMTNPLDGHLITIDFTNLSFKDLNENQVKRHEATFYRLSNLNGKTVETPVTLYYSLEDNTTKWWLHSDSETELTSSEMGILYKKQQVNQRGVAYSACVQEVDAGTPYVTTGYTLYEQQTLQNNVPTKTGEYAMATHLNTNGSSSTDKWFVVPNTTTQLDSLNTKWSAVFRLSDGTVNSTTATTVILSSNTYTVPTFNSAVSFINKIDENGNVVSILYPSLTLNF